MNTRAGNIRKRYAGSSASNGVLLKYVISEVTIIHVNYKIIKTPIWMKFLKVVYVMASIYHFIIRSKPSVFRIPIFCIIQLVIPEKYRTVLIIYMYIYVK